jgi:hypothetical protein
MDEITAPRIEALSQSLDLDKRFVKQAQLRKREKPGNPSPSPDIEADDPTEDTHQIDELA